MINLFYCYITATEAFTMNDKIENYTTGYLAPIKIYIKHEEYHFYDAFLYNINETILMESIIENIILKNNIFLLKNNVGHILKENARQQIATQLDMYKRVIQHDGIRFKNYIIPVSLEFNFQHLSFKDMPVFQSFIDYEPELYANETCFEYKIPLDSSKYMSFAIREQVYMFLKNVYMNKFRK